MADNLVTNITELNVGYTFIEIWKFSLHIPSDF
jgi:hypothetical protein